MSFEPKLLQLCEDCFNIGRLSSIDISGESVRQLVEYEGRKVTNERTRGNIDIGWSSVDCTLEDAAQSSTTSSATHDAANEQQKLGPTRVYVGCDGVKVPVVTQAEKTKRRTTIKLKRRRSVIATRGDCEVTGRLLRSMATTIKLDEATESIANIDGAPWIRNQLEFHNIVDEINLDYYHMKDNAQKARREMFGDDESGATWLTALTNNLMEQGVDALLTELLTQKPNLLRSTTSSLRTVDRICFGAS